MLIFKSSRHTHLKPLTCSVMRETLRRIGVTTGIYNKNNVYKKEDSEELQPVELIEKYGSLVLYNSYIENHTLKRGYQKNMAMVIATERFREKMEQTMQTVQPLPLSLKYLSHEWGIQPQKTEKVQHEKPDIQVQFPFEGNVSVEKVQVIKSSSDTTASVDDEMREKYKNIKHWMKSFDNFEDDLNETDEAIDTMSDWSINYGTPDPKSKVSNVPCGGCGAYLHCKDTAIPGYIPSEIFKNHSKKGAAALQSIICQRCYFLREHNMALQVRVSPEDYPKILTTIKGARALVVLMVDVMDFPCSIWPGIADILGPKTPIYVVGNKVDLLPKDCEKFLTNVRRRLLDYIKICGFGSANIVGLSLISAKTNFGIENFITELSRVWKYRGDVYLVGCTNVGKSSLFNALLQSDYCKTQATDLIQRATVSQWPGTTLNLLKFPITRLAGHRLLLRYQRISALKRIEAEENKIRSEQNHLIKSKSIENATLIGHIGHSFTRRIEEADENKDTFATQGNVNASGRYKMGVNEKHPDFATSKWCYDTPGVIQPDQIINILTVQELMLTIPKQLIRAETFCLKPKSSIFIAGLARLDYLDGPKSVRFTVFRSCDLPITVCMLHQADEVYKQLLGTELFKVPINEGNRLSKWPGLEQLKPFRVKGTHNKYSSKDVVLSSAGWIALNCVQGLEFEFQGWTPQKRGFYVRDCLLPRAVCLRGARVKESVAYRKHKLI